MRTQRLARAATQGLIRSKGESRFLCALSKLFCRARAGDRFPTPIEDNVAAKLAKQERFERFDVTVLGDSNATKSNILKAIEDLGERIHPEDELFIFIASHGTAAQDHFYLIPYDMGFTGNRTQLDEQAVSTILQHS